MTENVVKERIIVDYRKALRKAREEYEEEGWVVNDVGIKTEKIPLREKTEQLEHGTGVELISPDCGCRWRVNGDGTIERIFHCDDSECDGLLKHKPKIPEKGSLVKEEKKPSEMAPACWDHPDHRMVKNKFGNWTCPSERD